MSLAHIEPQRPTGSLLALSSVEQAVSLAERICKTNFVPAAYRGKPEETLACILYGHELNLGPMQALNSIDIIQGSVFLSAKLCRAMALSVGGQIEPNADESTPERGVVNVFRRGWAGPKKVEYTLEMAQRFGLTNRDQWKRDPAGMLINRATTRAANWYFSDVLKGMATEGDVEDFTPPVASDPVASEPVEAPSIASIAQKKMAQLPTAESAAEEAPLPLGETAQYGDPNWWIDHLKAAGVPLTALRQPFRVTSFRDLTGMDDEKRTAVLAFVANYSVIDEG